MAAPEQIGSYDIRGKIENSSGSTARSRHCVSAIAHSELRPKDRAKEPTRVRRCFPRRNNAGGVAAANRSMLEVVGFIDRFDFAIEGERDNWLAVPLARALPWLIQTAGDRSRLQARN